MGKLNLLIPDAILERWQRQRDEEEWKRLTSAQDEPRPTKPRLGQISRSTHRQAHRAKILAKRRAKNKVARKSRKRNRV